MSKRKRVTISCLNCNKRKVKCDRTLPCNNCRSRGEIHLCEYEPGQHPEPFREPDTPVELEILRRRITSLEADVDRLARARPSSSLPTPTASTPPAAHGSDAKMTLFEETMIRLDGLTRPRVAAVRGVRAEAPSAWPSIFRNDGHLATPKYTRQIQDICSAFPDEQTIDILVQHHLGDVSVLWRCLHGGVFRQEVAQFTLARQTDGLALVDPAWLALLIAVLSVTCHLVCYGGAPVPIDTTSFPALIARLDEAYDEALLCAEILHKPQFRILQSLVIMVSHRRLHIHFSSFDDDADTKSRGLMWHDVAISNCFHLGLHRLDIHEPPPDPAFPTHSSIYARQVCARVLYGLIFVGDVLGSIEAERQRPASMVMHNFGGITTTPPPGNYRDADLWPPTSACEPSPIFVRTEAIWQIHAIRIAHYWKVLSSLLRDPRTLTRDTVTSMDTQIRRDNSDLLSLRLGNRLTHAEDLIVESIHGSYQQRLLRLHRTYFLRSYDDPTMAYSQAAALSAARGILKGHHDAATKFASLIPPYMAIVYHAHHVSAVVILFVHGCLSPSSRLDIQAELRDSLVHTTRANEQMPEAVTDAHDIVAAAASALDDPPSTMEQIETFFMSIGRPPPAPPQEQVPDVAFDGIADFDWDSFFVQF